MKKQGNILQIKKQNKTPQKELNKMEISNLLDAEFKTLIIRILNEPWEKINELSENLNKEI